MQQEGALGMQVCAAPSRAGRRTGEQREGTTLHRSDKRLQGSPGITHSYGLFVVCMQSYL